MQPAGDFRVVLRHICASDDELVIENTAGENDCSDLDRPMIGNVVGTQRTHKFPVAIEKKRIEIRRDQIGRVSDRAHLDGERASVSCVAGQKIIANDSDGIVADFRKRYKQAWVNFPVSANYFTAWIKDGNGCVKRNGTLLV